MDGQDFCYHVGGRTAIGIRRCDPEFSAETFQQYRVGLHHLCLRAKSRDDVDRTYELLTQINAKVVLAPKNEIGLQVIIMYYLKTQMEFG